MIFFIIPHRPVSIGIIALINRFNLSGIDKYIKKIKVIFISDGVPCCNYGLLTSLNEYFVFLINCYKPGANGSRNTGLKYIFNNYSEDSHVIFFDDDDSFPINFLEKLFSQKFNCDICYCFNFTIKSINKHKIGNTKRTNLSHAKVFEYNIYGPPIRHLISVTHLKKHSIFWDENLVACQDWDFYCRLYSDNYKPVYVSNVVVYYNETISGITSDYEKVLNGRVQFFNKNLLAMDNSIKISFYINSIFFFIKRGYFKNILVFHKYLDFKFQTNMLNLVLRAALRK